MKQCPFCMGQVPDAATKCQHCGEWLDGRGSRREPDPGQHDSGLGRAANRYVSFQIIMSVVGLIVMLLFFFAFFLPRQQSTLPNFDPAPRFPALPR